MCFVAKKTPTCKTSVPLANVVVDLRSVTRVKRLYEAGLDQCRN